MFLQRVRECKKCLQVSDAIYLSVKTWYVINYIPMKSTVHISSNLSHNYLIIKSFLYGTTLACCISIKTGINVL